MTMPIEAPRAEPLDIPGFGQGRKIKSTTSLCPECLTPVNAEVYERDQKVWMDKRCFEHGPYSVLLASDVRHYYLADERLEGLSSCCGPGQHCGDQVANHSCNMLIEITQSCNLTCPTCYAGSSPENQDFMSFERFEKLIDGLLAKGKANADLIQLSGGEPTIHPRLFDMIDLALNRGIRQVYINTNGIKLANREFAERLAGYGSRVSVYFQFDSFRRSNLAILRGSANLLDLKLKALDHCDALGINTVPVMTLTRGVNDGELGAWLAMAGSRPRSIRKVMIQPAMYSGRYENPRLVDRVTVADVARLISDQTQGLFCEDDFTPIPCSDPNCFSMALALRGPDGLIPVSRYFPQYQNWGDAQTRELISTVTDCFDGAEDLQSVVSWALSSGAIETLDERAVDALLDIVSHWQASQVARPTGDGGDGAGGWDGFFAIGIKPFMDAYTYDQDRIDKCCVHVIAKDGTPVSFCEYNAINRPQGAL